MTDDQGYGDLSCMGATDFRTPHLDRMAAGGARFACWLSERVGLFANDRAVLVHGDAHFNNVLWDAEQGLTLIDFEVATQLAADRELEAIVDMLLDPAEYAAPGQSVRLSRRDFDGVLQALKDRYPGLFVSDADERMRVYFTLRALLQCHHFAGGSARDPRPRLRALMDGTFRFPVALSGTG